MPRRGKRGSRAPLGRAPHHLRSSRDLDRATPSPANAGLAAFTLQDEARSTAHHSSPWSAGSRLRHRPVAFVSTGSIEFLKQLEKDILQHEPNSQTANEPEVADPKHDGAPQGEPASTVDEARLLGTNSEPDARDVAISVENEAFSSLRTDEEDNQNDDEPEPEPEPELAEEASAPVPFFLDVTGDRNSHRKAPVRMQPRSPSPAASDSSEEVILFRGRNNTSQASHIPMSNNKSFNLHGIRTEINVVEESVKPKGDRITFSRSDRHNSRRQSVREQKRQEDDELIADYIANMREHGDDEGLVPADAYSKWDIGSSLSEFESVEESFNTITASGDPRLLSDDESEPGDAPDETNEATQCSDLDHTPTKHANKGKNSGEAALGDDALLAVIETDVSYLGSLEQSHAEDVSLPSETSEQEDDDDHVFNNVSDRFANEIDDFDFMDWERPALKRKKKGAKNRIPVFNISDSELEEKLQTAWSNDRMKKADKKRRRQALRAQGLLGKHANPEDLRVKYPDGMGLDQVFDELRTFLMGTTAILTLPPMNNHSRKVIHELASKFNIKSKSTGSGDQRRPMLHRTFRTAKFAEETFDAVIARVGRKHFPRNDIAPRAAVQRQFARSAGGGHAGINYRDGEVVGGFAPELGQGNKGRAMLEKMGWSSGTALGAINNKGILQPVAHVVKRSKAGLG